MEKLAKHSHAVGLWKDPRELLPKVRVRVRKLL
jgi:hypothetical protein